MTVGNRLVYINEYHSGNTNVQTTMITVTKDTFQVQSVRLLNTGARRFNDEIAKVYGEQVFFPLWESDKKVVMA